MIDAAFSRRISGRRAASRPVRTVSSTNIFA
jgi:hypothetical protein